MDHNTSVDRKQATTQDGDLRFKVQFSKGAADFVAKPIKEAKDYVYRQDILNGVVRRCNEGKLCKETYQYGLCQSEWEGHTSL